MRISLVVSDDGRPQLKMRLTWFILFIKVHKTCVCGVECVCVCVWGGGGGCMCGHRKYMYIETTVPNKLHTINTTTRYSSWRLLMPLDMFCFAQKY